MKPGFIIIVAIGIILVLAVLQSSSSSFTELNSSMIDDETPAPASKSSGGSSSNQNPSHNVELYGRSASPFIGMVELKKRQARNDDPKKEYVELEADNDNTTPITITGWKLESIVTKNKVSIGNAALVPVYPERNIANSPVVLQPDDRAYIISGSSPISVSFRTNKCIGYIGENRTFRPKLPKECPAPEDENLQKFGIDPNPREVDSDYECIKELKRIGTCENPGKPDDDLNNDCKDYINQLDYGFCAGLHLNDPDFAGDEWYLYVGKGTVDIWDDEDDIILLLDAAGRVVDSVSY